MTESKRERDRKKRVARQRVRAREQAQKAQSESRRLKAYDEAERAEELYARGNYVQALPHVARAAALDPRDVDLARFYLDVAQRSRDDAAELKAVEHCIRCTGPHVTLLITKAFLELRTGQIQAARATATLARPLLRRRVKNHEHWVALLRHVETSCARPDESVDTTSRQRPVEGEMGRAQQQRYGARALSHAQKVETRAAPVAQAKATGAEAARPAVAAAPVQFEVPIEIACEVEGLDALFAAEFASPDDVVLAGLAATIRDAESYQTLFAVERARGLIRFAHQEDTARKVLSVFLGRALLADEVGLGKTIEAGLILSEYLHRKRVDRALVLSPPSLVAQWREELQAKFAIEARSTDDAGLRSDAAGFWSRPGVVIASLATARSQRHRDLAMGTPWDLVIVDEAHTLKNASTESYKFVAGITTRFLLLLTATPVETRIEELYNLVSLIRPGHLGARSAFLKRFSDASMRSSDVARAQVRALLSEVMVRNTRALSGVQLPPRFARTVLVAPDPAEAELYEQLAAALRVLGPGGRTRLLLSLLLQEAGSSPYAARATLEKLQQDADTTPELRQALLPAIACAAQSLTTGKSAALLRALEGGSEPIIVFTRFRATLDFLSDVLRLAGITHEKIDGNVPAPRRQEAIGRLRQQRAGVLLATEVGAEGLNLQFCHRIVNYDLPWSPMRIEQRIGRVHRIGQEHPVEVVNLCLAGSIEERILRILDERINLFELVVGETEMILGYLEDERDFPDLMFDAFAQGDPVLREQSFTRIGDALAAARTRYENVKRFDEEFFRNELGA